VSQPVFFIGLRLMPEFDYRSQLRFSSLFMQRLHLSAPFLVSAMASLVLRVLLIKLVNLHPASAGHSAHPGFSLSRCILDLPPLVFVFLGAGSVQIWVTSLLVGPQPLPVPHRLTSRTQAPSARSWFSS
jgi:hypothetical protein